MSVSVEGLQRQRTGNAKIREEDAAVIKWLVTKGNKSPREVAGMFNLGIEAVRRIGRGEAWRQTPARPPSYVAPPVDELAEFVAPDLTQDQANLVRDLNLSPDPVTAAVADKAAAFLGRR